MPSPSTILLINPPSGLYRRDDRCQSRVEDQTVNVVLPPMELAQYAAVAREAGWAPRIRDYPAMAAGWEAFREDIASAPPDVLLINTILATAETDLRAAAEMKRARPETVTVARGEYPHDLAAKLLADEPALDVMLTGEAEALLPGLLARIAEGEREFPPPGQGPRTLVEDLDALPFPARDLLDNNLYSNPETGRRMAVIQAHRGCPSKCVFCPAGALSGYRVRFRAPERVVEELAECVERHGIREFLFNGDTFTIRKSWVIELCERICAAGLKLRWYCNSRVDTIDDERAQWMKRAGCAVVAFGIESGSQMMLDKMGKGAKVEQAFDAVRTVQRAGLLAHTFYVIGLPWETLETLEQTFRFAKRLGADFFDINIADPLPGTELWEIAKRDNLFEGVAPSDSSYAQAALRAYELSGAELTAWRRKALLRLYLRPGYIARTLGRLRSPRVLKNYLMAAARRLKSLLT